MDIFVEQIVAKKKDGKQIAIIVGTLLLALLLAAVVVMFSLYLYILVPVLLIGLGYGAWWLITQQNIEFEYSVTNGDIDIDQITARRKRKRIVSVGGGKIESAGRYDAAKWANRKIDRFVMAAPSPHEEELYFFTYHSKKRGHTLVVFQPEERVREALYKALPRLVQLDWDKT
ncbi:MAG: hypothetical protein IKA63_04640 [Clostridia bacterium]|nr:hypothetical protein [Clostridia bacterium]